MIFVIMEYSINDKNYDSIMTLIIIIRIIIIIIIMIMTLIIKQ